MQIGEYVDIVRGRWITIAVAIAICLAGAGAYLYLTPKSYTSTAVLLVSTSDSSTAAELQQGAQFSASTINTYAEIIQSSAVLAGVSATLTPARSVVDLSSMVSAVRRPGTMLIDVTAEGADPGDLPAIADAAASNAARVIPALMAPEGVPSLVRLQVILLADQPNAALGPNARKTLAIGALIGLLLGLVVAIIKASSDTRIRRIDDIKSLTRVPLLTSVPAVGKRTSGKLGMRNPSGLAGESYRVLGMNLMFADLGGRNSLMVAGVTGSGSSVPINLARTLAQAGHRVLLVDLDLHGSTVAAEMNIPSGPGISDVLAGRMELSEAIFAVDQANLLVAPAGNAGADASDLLITPVLRSTVAAMESSYDYVIANVPQVLSSIDAMIVAQAVGGCVIAVTAGRTRGPDLTKALDRLDQVGIRPVGIVLTQAAESRASRLGDGVPSRTSEQDPGTLSPSHRA